MKKIITNMTFEKLLLKVLSVWLIGLTLTTAINPTLIFEENFFENANIVALFAVAIPLFFGLLFVNNKNKDAFADKAIALTLFCIYYFTTIAFSENIYFFMAMCGVLFVLVAYTFGNKVIKPKSKALTHNASKTTLHIIVIAFVFLTLFIGVFDSYKHKTFNTASFDFGIFAQMFESMRESFSQVTTCERDKFLSHFAVHVSPAFYLILPIYWLFPRPETLLVCQGLVVASGVFPLYLLCKKYKLSNFVTSLVCVTFTIYPPIINGCFTEIHENMFLTPFIMWLLYFIEKNNNFGIIAFSILTCMVKEDAPVYLAFIALFVIFSKKKYKKGSLMFLFAVGYFLFVTFMLKNFGEGVMVDRYGNYGGDGLISVIKAVITNPAYVLNQCVSGEERIKFVIQMFLPLAFVPFILKDFGKVFLLAPILLFNLMSTTHYQYQIGYQYTFGIAAFLFYLVVNNLSQMNGKWKRVLSIFMAISTFMLFANVTLIKSNFLSLYYENKQTYQAVEEIIDEIPKDKSVAASTFLVSHFYDFDEIYRFPSNNQTEYLVIDLDYKFIDNEKQEYDKLISSGKYEKTAEIKDVIVVYKLK